MKRYPTGKQLEVTVSFGGPFDLGLPFRELRRLLCCDELPATGQAYANHGAGTLQIAWTSTNGVVFLGWFWKCDMLSPFKGIQQNVI